jgi:Family of unknown function (DUF6445)
MTPHVIVIDDFLPNAEELREYALGLTYALKGPYPGLDSVKKTKIDGLDDIVSTLVYQPVRAPWTPNYAHGNFRIALATDDGEPARIHIDESHWSGILYLSQPEDCRGGTEFYRHLVTGTDHAPFTQEGLAAMGYSSYGELNADLLERDGRDRSKWERTMVVPMRFNRLVLQQPQYWHTAGPSFGDSIENGRLVYLMRFFLSPAATELRQGEQS